MDVPIQLSYCKSPLSSTDLSLSWPDVEEMICTVVDFKVYPHEIVGPRN